MSNTYRHKEYGKYKRNKKSDKSKFSKFLKHKEIFEFGCIYCDFKLYEQVGRRKKRRLFLKEVNKEMKMLQ